MSSRIWAYTVIAVAAILVIGGMSERMEVGAATPRMQQSQPTVSVPDQMVAVTPDGKTFHDPSCKAIHGKPVMMSAKDAIAKGYVPCVRCMRKALVK